MKKLISIIATVAIVLSMGVTALAAGSEVAKKDSTVTATDESGKAIDVYEANDLPSGAVEDLVKESADKVEVVEVTGAGTFAFTFSDAGKVTSVKFYNGSAWETLDFTKDGDKITVAVKGAGAIAFIVETAKQSNNGKASAQTGYDSAAYIVCAVVLAAGAAFFFGTSKKSVKEM